MSGEAASPPKAPYRQEGELDTFIERDHRLRRALLFIAIGMAAGAALYAASARWIAARERASLAASQPSSPQRLRRVVLSGPDGTSVLGTHAAVLHVWLQGCEDCMPAFQAMRELEANGGLGVDLPVYNVAYGQADPAWADKWRVRRNLLLDPGGEAIVRPLGIGTFTTFVIDRKGDIVLRLRPVEPDYLARVQAAAAEASTRGGP